MYGFRDAELQHAAWQMRCAMRAQAYMHMHMCMADALRGVRAQARAVSSRAAAALFREIQTTEHNTEATKHRG
jgi:hypothetical protein